MLRVPFERSADIMLNNQGLKVLLSLLWCVAPNPEFSSSSRQSSCQATITDKASYIFSLISGRLCSAAVPVVGALFLLFQPAPTLQILFYGICFGLSCVFCPYWDSGAMV